MTVDPQSPGFRAELIGLIGRHFRAGMSRAALARELRRQAAGLLRTDQAAKAMLGKLGEGGRR